MTTASERVKSEVDKLRAVRDELRLQMHLGTAEARDTFERLEKRWKTMEAHVRSLESATREDRERVAEAARTLAREIGDGYRHLRGLL
jgi:chaperonin cofactor prefoldin